MKPTREMRPRAIITSGLGGAIIGTGGTSTDEGEHVLVIEGGRDQGFAHGSLGPTEDIDPTDGNVHTGTLTADCTITLLDPDATRVNGVTFLEVRLTEDGTGGWTPTFTSDGSITWIGGSTPAHTTTAGTTTIYLFETLDDGLTWLGAQVGSGGASPASTVEDETTFGISPAVGTDVEYARGDHTHGTPAASELGSELVALGVVGAILIADDHSTPIIFGDLLLTEAGDDFLYADIG